MTEAHHDLQQIFNEVRPVRGFEDIALQIQQAVYDGRLKAGDKLPSERELGQLFGVSRPTLREAIRVLEAEGTVEVRRGTTGGTFIAQPNPQQVGQALEALIRFRGATWDDLAEFRANFESETAYWAARRATPEQVERLADIARKFEQEAMAGIPWSELVQLDIAFHQQVADASQNQIRVAIMLAVHEVMNRASLIIGQADDPAWRRQQASDLHAIAEAIRRRQVRLASKWMKQHVTRNIEAGAAKHTEVTAVRGGGASPVTQLQGRALVAAAAEGPVLASNVPLSFWGGLNPATGEVVDQHHPLAGRNVSGTVLVLPRGRGSCSASGVLLEAMLNGHGPAGILLRDVDDVIALGPVVAEEMFDTRIPVIVLGPDGYQAALAATRARIGEDGTVTLD